MRAGLAVLAILVLGAALGGLYAYNLYLAPPGNNPPACSDAASIKDHVYNPQRLQTFKECISVSGVVDAVIREADGDFHVRLRLDPDYSNLTNNVNDQNQYGDLIVEIICAIPVSQADAVASCQSYTNSILIPDVGQHIVVSGPYVLDRDHGWMEIHPVYTLTISG